MFPVLAKRENQSSAEVKERENSKEWIHIIENFFLLSVPFLSGSNIFDIHQSEFSLLLAFEFWLQVFLKLGFGEGL